MSIRIGFGFDVHQLEAGLPLWLGGIKVPSEKGARGHSDADVLIHAICDAMLGALALRDIGYHFPDTSDEYKGIDSKILLQKVAKLIHEKAYKIGNIDTTVCLESPKISPHIDKMTYVLSEILNIESSQLSIKATTTEKMGYTGRGEGICAYASVLLIKE